MINTGGAQKKTTDDCRVYTVSEARRNFADLFDEAVSSGRVIVARRRKTIAWVDAEWLEEMESRLAKLEADEAEQARRQMEKSGGKDLNQFEEEVGLKK